jgi:hypothetical protein
MLTQTAMSYLTFDIRGRTVKVDPDIYYQIFNIHPSRPYKKYVGDIIGLRFSGPKNNYPAILFGSNPTRLVALSRFIMNPPEDKVVDHINGDRLDNRRENLRIATYRQNALNIKSRTNTGFIGVSAHTKKNGRSYCKVQFYDSSGKSHSFYAADCHEHRILAAYAHDKFVLQCGDEEFAPLNFESFKYEPFRSFLLETDLNKYKIRLGLTPAPACPVRLALLDASISFLKML